MSYSNKKTRGHPAASAAHDRLPAGGNKRQQNQNNMMNIEDNQQSSINSNQNKNEFENTDPY